MASNIEQMVSKLLTVLAVVRASTSRRVIFLYLYVCNNWWGRGLRCMYVITGGVGG